MLSVGFFSWIHWQYVLKVNSFPPFLNNKHSLFVGWRSRRVAVTLSLPGRHLEKDVYMTVKEFPKFWQLQNAIWKTYLQWRTPFWTQQFNNSEDAPINYLKRKAGYTGGLVYLSLSCELQSISKTVKRLIHSNVIDSQYICNWGIASMIQMLRNSFQTFPMETRGPRNTLLFSQH